MASPSLSEESIHRTIDKVLASMSPDGDVILRRTTTPNDWSSVLSFLDPSKKDNPESEAFASPPDIRTPFYFGIQAQASESDESVVGFCTFYIAYSTWDGRMLYADQISAESEGSLLLYRIMSKIATEIGCARLTWKQKGRPKWNLEMADPEHHEDLIFLSMDRLAMANFVGLSEIPSSSYLVDDQGKDRSVKPMLFLRIEDTIREVLEEQSMTTKSGATVNLRLAEADDTEIISGFVNGLAISVKEPDAVNVTAQDYFVDGFNSSDPLFYCILVDFTHPGETEPKTVAMGVFYFGHDLLDGPFLYLEDLYCDEAYRKQGIGTELMKQLAQISLELDCSKFTWVALDWNAPALAFYKKIGAIMQTEEKITRYCGSDLESFVRST